ncbi:MAG: peroxiredoxin family protein [Planctomycetota bacterium]|jgi:cytochrome oxidase Cu insertion factor (SCO1/SenC/PrrC family)
MRWKILSFAPIAILLCLAPLASAEVPVGSPAPDFTLDDANRDPHSLSDFQGKVVLIFFWQHW